MLITRKTMVSWQAFPSLLPRAPLAFLSRPKLPFLKLPFPSLSNASHAGYFIHEWGISLVNKLYVAESEHRHFAVIIIIIISWHFIDVK